jgi:hypothetical protein
MRAVIERVGLWRRSMSDRMQPAFEKVVERIEPLYARTAIDRWAVIAALLTVVIAGFSYYQARVTRDLLNVKLDELSKKVDGLDPRHARQAPPASPARPQGR